MLNLEGVNQLRIKKYVKELDEELDILINTRFIDFSWESLEFPENDLLFASVVGKRGSLDLRTQGEVRIIDTMDDRIYTNKSNFSDALTKEIQINNIYSSDRFVVAYF